MLGWVGWERCGLAKETACAKVLRQVEQGVGGPKKMPAHLSLSGMQKLRGRSSKRSSEEAGRSQVPQS